MHKIRFLTKVGSALLAGVMIVTSSAAAQGTTVAGTLVLREQGDKPSPEVGSAVIWLTGDHAPAAVPDTVEMATEGKQFVPHLLIVPRGSTVTFPNHDPFNHNVFSLSPAAKFDLGLFGRGENHGYAFGNAGIVRVYCNVHAQMRGLVLVHDTRLVTQPGADGKFKLTGVPPGDYTLNLWHERASTTTVPVKVTAAGVDNLALTMDARGYRLVQHRDKNGQSYSDRKRRY
jgi:plastocyanin